MERFPSKKSSKLKPQADGPFKVQQRIGENAYKNELLGDYGVSTTFSVSDLSSYCEIKKTKWTWGQVLSNKGSLIPECH